MESEIVITGVSGRFPESDNIAEFSENLFNKVDLLTEDDRRWEPGKTLPILLKLLIIKIYISLL